MRCQIDGGVGGDHFNGYLRMLLAKRDDKRWQEFHRNVDCSRNPQMPARNVALTARAVGGFVEQSEARLCLGMEHQPLISGCHGTRGAGEQADAKFGFEA